jgi:ATP-binding cassette, subfamily B, bacterial
MLEGRTFIIIVHRLTTICSTDAITDAIVVLDHGRVDEMGNHAGILQSKNLYARLQALHYGLSQRDLALTSDGGMLVPAPAPRD